MRPQFELALQAWAVQAGLNERYVRTIAKARLGHFADLAAPDASLPILLLIAKAEALPIVINTVDLHERPVSDLTEPVARILEGGSPRQSAGRYLQAVATFRDEIVEAGGTALLPGLADVFRALYREYERRQEWRTRGHVPMLAEYLSHRKIAAGAIPGMWLQRLQPGLVGPADSFPSRLRHLFKQTNLLIGLDNDLQSCHKGSGNRRRSERRPHHRPRVCGLGQQRLSRSAGPDRWVAS